MYEKALKAIRACGPTMLPALLGELVKTGYLKGVFVPGGAGELVRRIEAEIEQTGLDKQSEPQRGFPSTTAEWPRTNTICSVCKEPQYKTPAGPCCTNGHGGAPPLE
jgi:hypothetical protein